MIKTIDFIIRLKNGYLAKKEFITLFHSRILEEILKILKREKYIKEYQIEENNKKKLIKIFLLYQNRKPALTNIEIISKPGRKIYSKIRDLKPVLGGVGLAILSTPKGIKTDKKARKENVGGKVLFRIW
jgi:small subunit ribosomal protein S8